MTAIDVTLKFLKIEVFMETNKRQGVSFSGGTRIETSEVEEAVSFNYFKSKTEGPN